MNSLQTALWIKKQIFMKNNCDQDSQLSKQIVQWYLKNGRSDLPWRKNVTAYRVWISEIMLQQTQVKTVIPFFKKRFHSIHHFFEFVGRFRVLILGQ